MKSLFTIILGLFLLGSIVEAQVVITSTDNFLTRDQMLLANEINESGEPFAEALGYDLDLLDPMVLNDPDSIPYTLGIENYEYSRYLLGTVISRSGIGLHMMWAPVIMQMAAMEPEEFDGKFTGGTPNGFKEDDELMKTIMHFGMLANQMAPMNPWPQFADFESGDPHFDPDNNIFYGGNSLDGFIGQVLTAESINKTLFLINSLAYDGTQLGMVDPATYDPSTGIKYFPHRIAVTESPVADMLPPKASDLQVTDASSDLFDQLSYLWAALSFKNMMDPGNSSDETHLAYHEVFDGDPFPASMSETGVPGPFDLMMGTSKVIFMNLMAMHYDMAGGTFVNTSGLSEGVPQPGNEISTVNASYITMVLSLMVEEFTGTPLEQMALDALNAQSSFIISSLKDPSGGYFNAYTLNSGSDNSAKSVEAQAAAARGLYAAYSLTGKTDYLNAANDAYNFLISNYYVAEQMAFKTEQDNDLATYTPFNFAIITGGLREAALVGEHTEAAAIYTRFFKNVANVMQLAEMDATGETGNDSDGDGIPYLPEQPDQLAPVFAAEAQLNLQATAVDNFNAYENAEVVIYPSPVRESATIGFNIESASNVMIEAIDFSGKSVQSILNSPLSEGQFNTSWDVNNLTSGIYFIRITIGRSGVITKKVVVL